MRTEHELRDAFAALADQAPPSDVVLERLRDPERRAPSGPRRTVLVLAAAVVVILALALPPLLTERTGVPADTRAQGNWNLVHRLALPAGLVVSQQVVRADVETSVVQPDSPAKQDTVGDCVVEVHGPAADPMPERTSQDTEVTVQGRVGFYRKPSGSGAPNGGVYWQHGATAWTRVSVLPSTWASGSGRPAAPIPASSSASR